MTTPTTLSPNELVKTLNTAEIALSDAATFTSVSPNAIQAALYSLAQSTGSIVRPYTAPNEIIGALTYLTANASSGVAAATGEIQLLGASTLGVGLSDTGVADATNLAYSTENLSAIEWLPSYLTVVDGAVTPPTIANNAASVTEINNSGTAQYRMSQGFAGPGSATQYTMEVRVKAGLRTRVLIGFHDQSTTAYAQVLFDLAGAQIAVAPSHSGAWTAGTASITADTNGFYNCVFTATSSTQTGLYFYMSSDAGSGTNTYDVLYTGSNASPSLYYTAVRLYTGAASGTYTSANTNYGSASTQLTTDVNINSNTGWWGTQTNNAWYGIDCGASCSFTRWRVMPRPNPAPGSAYPTNQGNVDAAQLLQGALLQTTASDPTFASPTTADTIPSVSTSATTLGSYTYYPSYWLSERVLSGATGRYIRVKPPNLSYGAVGAVQFFATAGATKKGCPVQPVISPNGGRFPGLSQSVTITSLTTNAAIYYTLDGSTPSTGSTLYTGPFTVTIPSGGSGTVTVKAVAYQASLSQPLSNITISAPFNGWGIKPADTWYDQHGNLVEAHSGCLVDNVAVDGYYYWVGMFMDVGTRYNSAAGYIEPQFAPGLWMYRSAYHYNGVNDSEDLINWTNLGQILPTMPGNWNNISRVGILYNAANSYWVLWANGIDSLYGGAETAWTATTASSSITSAWTWASSAYTTSASGTYRIGDFSLFYDPVSTNAFIVYADYWSGNAGINIGQLSSNYQAFSGNPYLIASSTTREAPSLVYDGSGTYYLVTSTRAVLDSDTTAFDIRYCTSTTVATNNWSSMNGTSIWSGGAPAAGNTYNIQPCQMFLPHGHSQYFLSGAYWVSSNLRNTRETWQPIVLTPGSPGTLVVTETPSWTVNQLS